MLNNLLYNFSDAFLLTPPPGLDIRPVNDANASTSGQTGRKEAAGWGSWAGTPLITCPPDRVPAKGQHAPWNPAI
jgi:hypothetical protein